MSIEECITAVKKARAAFEDVLGRVPEERVTEVGVTGKWSTKDVIAHVSWFELQMVALIRAKAFVGPDLWQLPPQDRNAAIFRENWGRTVADIRDEFARARIELLDALSTLDDEDLDDPGRFPGKPSDWRPGGLIAQNTYEHYDAHREGLLSWLKGSGPFSG